MLDRKKFFVIPERRQRVGAKRRPMTGSAASPESILRSLGYGFRVRAFGAPRNDGWGCT